jgi:hypothetical protein
MQRKIAKKTLIWQSVDENKPHFLVLIPSENIRPDANSYYFLRISQDINQIQIEMRFKNSAKLPWLSLDYRAVSSSLNHLAEAIALPAGQYPQARSQKNTAEIEKFHVIVLRLYARILKEMSLEKPVEAEDQKELIITSVECTEIENLLDALDDLDHL